MGQLCWGMVCVDWSAGMPGPSAGFLALARGTVPTLGRYRGGLGRWERLSILMASDAPAHLLCVTAFICAPQLCCFWCVSVLYNFSHRVSAIVSFFVHFCCVSFSHRVLACVGLFLVFSGAKSLWLLGMYSVCVWLKWPAHPCPLGTCTSVRCWL